MNAKLSGIKKHFPKLVMTVAMLLSILPASAYDFEADGIYYNITDATNHEVEVTSKVLYEASYSGDIDIPSTVTNGGTMYSVTSIGYHAFWHCWDMTSVTIPRSVISIGDKAFYWCDGLTSVSIPNSVTSIGDYAFYWCDGLTSITIPNSVTSIGVGPFASCSDLIEINVDPANNFYASVDGVLYNKNITEIIEYPAGKTKTETTFSIPNSVTSIGVEAFSGCTGLTSVTIPNSVISIGNMAFYRCDGLTSITIPSSVTSIGEFAFWDCSGLTSVTIPGSVISIGHRVFCDCDGLMEINVDPSNSSYASVDGVLYNKTLTEIVQYPAGKPETTFSIPSSVTSIGEYAFDGCKGLTSVTIPNSVTSIGWSAFWACSGLTSVNIPNSVTSIGVEAFSGCTGLTSITIPNSVTSIGSAAFQSCSGLTSVTIGNSVTSIGGWAFGNCEGLTSVTIPSSVTSIGYNAFGNCPLKSVYCHWKEPISSSDDFFSSKCYEEGTLYVPKGSANKYKSTDPWSNFRNIEESDNLGVEDILENQPTGDYIVYDLKGVLRLKTADMDEVKQLPAGLYIVNGKKMIIR